MECTKKKWCCNSPLHLGALYGHVNFVGEILTRKREFARELNSQGQSPLHLASERGHVEVVKKILSADADACFVRDRDGMIPLHLAAVKGRVNVLEELVKANRTTAYLLTETGEPILHLCANNNQFKALEKLVEFVADDSFVNLKDSNDNNILHLLSAMNRREVIQLLVKKTKALEVNAMNISGCTPLDVSMEYESGLGRLRTDWALITAGANKVGSIPGRKKTRILKKNHGSWFMEALLVVNILMITVLFQAALNPPGGIWQDTGYENVTLPSTRESSPRHVQVHHYAGQSVMSYVDPLKYKDFFMRNNISLISSMLVIEILLIRCFFNNWFLDLAPVFLTSISVVTMSSTYTVSLSFISNDIFHFSTSDTYLLALLSIIISNMSLTVPLLRMLYFLFFKTSSCWTTSRESGDVGRP
eukprot:TRINITY_DN14349_c0_g1_i2.p1 TRINITY_DN14349_c0_g1~~TRINITY_DN14349_c0_g1_i2.p1  ORF type:complete len:456 (+),score=35.36 TRINITY_DN14349_c0_g1_i2:116-1369(+)